MPVTRSQSGREGRREPVASNPPENRSVAAAPIAAAPLGGASEQIARSTESTSEVIASSGTETTTGGSATTTTGATTTTRTTETTETSRRKSTNTASGDAAAVAPTHSPEGAIIEAAPSRKSVRKSTSSKKSTKAQRLAKAKEELLQLQVQLAAARVAAIEEEGDSDEEIDADTVTTQQETTRRVTEWLNDSQPQLAIAHEPHNAHSPAQIVNSEVPLVDVPPPPPPELRPPSAQPPCAQASHGLAQSALPSASYAPRYAATVTAPENAPPSPPPQGAAAIAVRNTQQVDLSELASAIALAARSGHAPRHAQDLPLYFGSYQEWLSFRAAYYESEKYFNATENIARLRRSLRGRAKEAVETLLLYQATPAEVMKTLESRFGRPDAIATTEIERLRSLARPTDAPRDVCIFATKVFNVVNTIKALGKQFYLFNPEVTKTVIDKLTPTLRYRWFDYAIDTPSEEPDLIKIANFLQREADRCGPYAQPETTTSEGASIVNRNRSQGKDRFQKSYNTIEKKPSGDDKCSLCDKSCRHASECKDFTEANTMKRWEMAKNNRLCFRCLKIRTKQHKCPKRSCGTDGCEKTHHKLLHFQRREEEKEKEVVASTWATQSRGHALLKIIPVSVSGPRGTVQTYAILDDGSTVTLIDSEIADKTGARGPTDPLNIEAVSGNNVHVESRRGRHNQPVASRTALGWVLHGTATRALGHRVNFLSHTEGASDLGTGGRDDDNRQLNELLKQHFALESLVILPREPQSDPQQQALQVTVGRATQKRYVALFTCLTTRAVHLEVAASLSADSAVLALRRMIARRGCPIEIWSDNGTNLQGAARELREAMDVATAEEASRRGVSWRFITPSAPFMGGAWERLVRSVKTALQTVLHERHPSEETLHTLLAEVEYTVNSRPLTHVSVSPEDPEALTPNHFLLGGSAQTPPVYTTEDSDLVGREHWRASQRLADMFWARWIREYLPELQNRREPHGKGPAITTGDVVLIADGNLPRNTWPRGIVIATYPGPDGVVRTVDVRTKGGTLRRPTKKLVILPTTPAVAHGD